MQIGPKLAFSKAGETRTPELSPKLQIKENQPPSPVGNNPIGRERLFHFIKQEETNMAYRKIYFRIHTECYSSGRSSDTDRAAFKEESRRLFQELGWTVKLGCNGGCDTVSKDRQDLYLHPSSFSGVMDEANTEALQEKLTQARTFYCYHIDRYEEYRDLSDEGYRAELETKRDEIIAYILDSVYTRGRGCDRMELS